ncbi:serine protease [Mesorhizobium sp. M0478]|uniref:trypsin-like serine peptidase n=1 Tax=Mesorhizobium sp. M0478 TaxID=2956947 RepID=UPI00333C2776
MQLPEFCGCSGRINSITVATPTKEKRAYSIRCQSRKSQDFLKMDEHIDHDEYLCRHQHSPPSRIPASYDAFRTMVASSPGAHMDAKDIEVLTNAEIPEAVRTAIAQALITSGTAKSDHDLKIQQLGLDHRKFIWNTPLVAALAGLLTLSATFLFDRIAREDTTKNTVTLEQVRQELKDSEARTKQQLDTETTKTVAEIQALAKEREFQYEIVKSELSNLSKTNGERAAVLLFLARAGILNSLNRDELQAMAEEQIQNPDKEIIPRLTSNSVLPGVIGFDDSQLISSLPDQHPARQLARAVGRLAIQRKNQLVVCTAFLVGPSQIITATHCAKDAISIRFLLLPKGTIDGSVIFNVDLTKTKIVGSEDKMGGYASLGLDRPADASFTPLVISRNALSENATLGVIYFRTDGLPRTVWGVADCRVIKLEPNLIHHQCDTGPGSSGAPIIDLSTNSVVAVQFLRDDVGAVGYRLDSPR